MDETEYFCILENWTSCFMKVIRSCELKPRKNKNHRDRRSRLFLVFRGCGSVVKIIDIAQCRWFLVGVLPKHHHFSTKNHRHQPISMIFGSISIFFILNVDDFYHAFTGIVNIQNKNHRHRTKNHRYWSSQLCITFIGRGGGSAGFF